jgi:hypothetical protein
MHRDRIEKIRDHLRYNVKDERFNIAFWAGNTSQPWLGMPDLSCGTTACAMGHASTIPEFRDLGLYMVKENGKGWLQFGPYTHFEAAAAFLDISENAAIYMFDPDSYENGDYATRLEVVDQIDSFLKNGM